jgi:hypothetical protein
MEGKVQWLDSMCQHINHKHGQSLSNSEIAISMLSTPITMPVFGDNNYLLFL